MYLLRKLSFVFGLVALVVARPGFALGLGESELHSALNQPLRASVELTDLGDLDEGDLIVRLASVEDFEQAGIERPQFYSQLQFDLQLEHSDGPRVLITSSQPVREPYLSILMEVRWSSGRLLREYTFLLDLPTYDEERESESVEAASGDGGAAPRERSDRTGGDTERGETDRSAASTRPSYDGDTYTVEGNDTLWEIALQVRPGSDLSVHQTMLAIQRENPDAFINGNINMLREGQVLRLPDRQAIQRLDRQGAVNEVAEHNREWSGSEMGAQLDAGDRDTGDRSGPSEVSGQVRLDSPNQSEGEEAGQGGGDSTDRGAELESELAAAREELDKTQRENRELSSRVEELEEQIETMESLIAASNEQMRALEASAQQTREAEDEQAEQDQAARDQADEADSDAEAGPADDDEAGGADTEPGEEQTEEPSAAEDGEQAASPTEEQDETGEQASDDRNDRVVRSLPEQKGLVDHLMDNLLWIGAGLLVLLLGGLLIWQRRAAAGDGSADLIEEEPFEPGFESEDESGPSFAESDEDFQGIDLAGDEEPYESPTGEESLEPEETEESGVEAETGDVVGEAEIYIAYGKLDQAEELLLKGLDKEPHSPAVLVKLLEVYSQQQNIEAFDRHYATLLNTNDRGAIERAGELRDAIPGAGEFDVGAIAGAAEEPVSDEPAAAGGDEDLDFQFDLDESDSDSPESGQSTDEAPTLDLEDEGPSEAGGDETEQSPYDLNLDELESDTGSSQSSAPDTSDDFSLDFDLDESDSEAPSAGSNTGAAEDDWSESDLELTLDEEPDSGEAQGESSASGETEWEFDLSDSEEASAPSTEEREQSAGGEPSSEDDWLLDVGEDSGNDQTVQDVGEDRTASSEDEQEAGQDAFADLDLSDVESESGQDTAEPAETETPAADEQAPETQTETPATDEVPAADQAPAADQEEDKDFDLDDLDTDSMDLSSLDEQMSDLDADLDEGGDAPAPEDKPESAQAKEESSQTAEPEMAETTADDSGKATQPASGSQTREGEATDPDMDDELDFLADTDEAATKLDLARAYIDMGDADGARDILEEVRQEGDETQQQEASELLGRLDN